jgi:hypothetical protein
MLHDAEHHCPSPPCVSILSWQPGTSRFTLRGGCPGPTWVGRSCHQRGKRTGAWQLLAKSYGWVTEGFDTKDLQEAKALLDELAELQVHGHFW